MLTLSKKQACRYYVRVAGQVRSEAFKFWKQQILGGLILGIISVLIARKPEDTLPGIILTVLCPYGTIMILFLAYAVTLAPVIIDNRRSERIRMLRASAKRNARATEMKLAAAVPDDQTEKRRIVLAAIRDFSHGEREFLRWHAHRGKVRECDHQNSPVPQSEWQSALGKCRREGLILDEYTEGASPNFTYLNPDLKPAILAVLLLRQLPKDRPISESQGLR